MGIFYENRELSAVSISYGAGSPTAVVCSRELVSCGNGGLYAVVEWIPAAM